MRILIIAVFFFVGLLPAGAQQLLKGRVYDQQSDSTLPSATIFNATKKLYVLSTVNGDYAIVAEDGDKLVISSVGYRQDTLRVQHYMLNAGYDISLSLKNNSLKNVTVHGPNYVADSLSRREGYSAFYDKSEKQIISRSGPQNGVGIAFSPISFFSHRGKDRKMAKNLQYQEEQDFVNYSFSRRYVQKLTHLDGDSLTYFMIRYRPSYEFCRTASSGDMVQYINDSLMAYLHPKEGEKAAGKKKDQ
ncbi:MAG TPA: carboxypeptidase-like regulatory domain-containing protein [Chitinophagaceae bacterium]|nr:carboxypeptidase-like regulatory domain-containing protein [Chitinophagaceae bacterium]